MLWTGSLVFVLFLFGVVALAQEIDVAWINLNTSIERRNFMKSQLAHFNLTSNTRINAYTYRDIFIPKQILYFAHCIKVAPERLDDIQLRSSSDVIVSTICGRPKNTRRELSVTISHLNAIRLISSSNKFNEYALILEDDMKFAFRVDFKKLLKSAPFGFGMLQLITSNEYDVMNLWNIYQGNGELWTLRSTQDYWCAGAYIIRKSMLQPILANIWKKTKQEKNIVEIIAGYDKPCFPKYCCNGSHFETKGACIRSARGFQADHYIYSLAEGHTYILNVPIFVTASLGNTSTLHQEHVAFHYAAFHRIQQYINLMQTNQAKRPEFLHIEAEVDQS